MAEAGYVSLFFIPDNHRVIEYYCNFAQLIITIKPTMKNLLTAIILSPILFLLIVGCNNKRQADTETVVSTPRAHGKLIEDTTIGHWTIKNYLDSIGVVIKIDEWEYPDSSIFLNISYDDKCVFSDKEISTKKLMHGQGKFIMSGGGKVFWASDSALYLTFGCFAPESDFGDCFLYQIRPNGKTNIMTLDPQMGLDGSNVIDEFLAIYFNELAAGSSTDDLKRLFDKCCVKELADKLADGTVRIVSDSSATSDFQYAYRTTDIRVPDDYIDVTIDKYIVEVSFKPDPKNAKLTETLIVDIDSSVNKVADIQKDVTAQGLLGKVIERLKSEPCLNTFKLRKRDMTFYWQDDDNRRYIKLENWMDDGAIVIRPAYKVRFDILSNWFRPFSAKKLREHLEQPSVAFTGEAFGCQDKYIITEENFEQDYSVLRDEFSKCMFTLCSSYATMRDMYDNEIIPILEGKRAFPDNSAERMFQYLTLAKVVSPNDYPKVKELILSQIHILAEKQDPYIIEYLPRLDEIIAAMEEEFKDGVPTYIYIRPSIGIRCKY